MASTWPETKIVAHFPCILNLGPSFFAKSALYATQEKCAMSTSPRSTKKPLRNRRSSLHMNVPKLNFSHSQPRPYGSRRYAAIAAWPLRNHCGSRRSAAHGSGAAAAAPRHDVGFRCKLVPHQVEAEKTAAERNGIIESACTFACWHSRFTDIKRRRTARAVTLP